MTPEFLKNECARRKQRGVVFSPVPSFRASHGIQSGFLDTGFRRYDEFAASGGEYNPKGIEKSRKRVLPWPDTFDRIRSQGMGSIKGVRFRQTAVLGI